MKTKLLFTAMVFIGLTCANATASSFATQGEDFNNTTRYRFTEPIMFMERGVEFLVFPDGSFDFNTSAGDSFNDFDTSNYYRQTNTRRSSINTTQGAPGTNSRNHYYGPANGGVLIQHDYDGKVRRIGNVFINYDRVGKVKRVGTVYMNYNSGGMLTQVGGLHITYNRWGELAHVTGVVNYSNSNYNLAPVHGNSYQNSYGNQSEFETTEDYYYYRKNDQVKKQKRIKT